MSSKYVIFNGRSVFKAMICVMSAQPDSLAPNPLCRLWTRRSFGAGVLCAAPVWGWAQVATPLVMRVQAHDLARYQAYMAQRSPMDLDSMPRAGLTRHVAEMWLFKVAATMGGCGCSVQYQPYQADTTHARAIAEVVAGRLVSDPIAGFREDSRYAGQVGFSDAVLRGEDFLVGIYTHHSRADVLGAREVARLRELTYVIARSWEVDRRVLQAKGLRWIEADNWNSALRLIEARRADAILQPFSMQARRALAADGYEAAFVPVPGFMMRFGHSRHFTVSLRHPDGPALLQQINHGLRLLNERGFVQRLWLASGVIQADTRQFQEVA